LRIKNQRGSRQVPVNDDGELKTEENALSVQDAPNHSASGILSRAGILSCCQSALAPSIVDSKDGGTRILEIKTSITHNACGEVQYGIYSTNERTSHVRSTVRPELTNEQAMS
jgi:hypothetical protein